MKSLSLGRPRIPPAPPNTPSHCSRFIHFHQPKPHCSSTSLIFSRTRIPQQRPLRQAVPTFASDNWVYDKSLRGQASCISRKVNQPIDHAAYSQVRRKWILLNKDPVEWKDEPVVTLERYSGQAIPEAFLVMKT